MCVTLSFFSTISILKTRNYYFERSVNCHFARIILWISGMFIYVQYIDYIKFGLDEMSMFIYIAYRGEYIFIKIMYY